MNPPPRDLADIVDRLRLNSGPLVEELLKLTTKMADLDEARAAQLNAKAASLFAANGLAVTVAFTFGGTLLGRADLFSDLERKALAGTFVAALFVCLASGLLALRALLVRGDHVTLDDADIFARSQLDAADDAEDGLVVYRRFIIAHIWAMSRQNKSVLNDKATALRHGQIGFFAFMFLIFAIGAMFAHAIVWK